MFRMIISEDPALWKDRFSAFDGSMGNEDIEEIWYAEET